MSRTDYLTLGIVVICIAALAFLIYKIVSLPSDAPSDTSLEAANPAPMEADTSGYYTYDTVGDSEIESDSIGDDVDDEGEFTAIDDVPDSGNNPSVSGSSKTPEPKADPVVSEGDYMVLAGSFTIKSHAEAAVRNLQKKGYANASVEIFDRGKYAVALVDRFGVEAEAAELVKKLRQQGFDAQVYKKR